MKRVLTGFVGVAVAAAAVLLPQAISRSQQISPTPTAISAAPAAVVANNFGAAAEIENEIWLNTDAPLRLADLRGQVVLLEFWTFDCINCIHTIPSVSAWHETYAEQGLTVIGVHYPEFQYERDIDNLRAAMDRLGVTYPVAQDNDGLTWRAYNQRYWPTIYLIDKRGDIRYIRIGEGRYEQTEAAIQALLAEPYEA